MRTPMKRNTTFSKGRDDTPAPGEDAVRHRAHVLGYSLEYMPDGRWKLDDGKGYAPTFVTLFAVARWLG